MRESYTATAPPARAPVEIVGHRRVAQGDILDQLVHRTGAETAQVLDPTLTAHAS